MLYDRNCAMIIFTYLSNGHFTEIDEMVTPLKATIDFKVKGNAVKQEVEKNQELVRSALRAVAALSKLADIGKHSAYILVFIQPMYLHLLTYLYHLLQHRPQNSSNSRMKSRVARMLTNIRTYGMIVRVKNIVVAI